MRCSMRRIGFKTLVVLMAVAALDPARGREFEIIDGSYIVGEARVHEARYEDTFIKLAREHDLGYTELVHANPGVDPWLPGEGIVINLPELRLYYFPEDKPGRVITHPISIGRMDWGTPLGLTHVQSKAQNPTWYPPESIREEHALDNRPLPRVVPPGPDNPLGKHALRLALPGYLIHGTNKPAGLGMRVTHGCIRMFPEDIEALFASVPIGTPVRIVNQPYKIGWTDGGFYLEAHRPLDEEFVNGWTMTALTRAFVLATEDEEREVESFSWDLAERVVERGSGIPEFVSLETTTSL